MRFLQLVLAALLLFLPSAGASAQNPGTPGQFDFYLLDIAWGPDFCNVPGIVAPCTPPRSFVLHGLWPQNNNGSYPVNCGSATPLTRPDIVLDLTPNLGLIQHEWDKHGTCTTLSQSEYFGAARKAYRRFKIPPALAHPADAVSTTSAQILNLFHKANPKLPAGSITLGCSKGKFTQIAECLDKNLNPIACSNVHLCKDDSMIIAAPISPIR